MQLRRSHAVVAALGLIVATGCHDKAKGQAQKPPPRPIDVVTLQPAPLRETGEYLGTLRSRASATVLPQVAGYVRKVYVTPGQKVAAGAPLVDIDARRAQAAVASANAQVEASRVAVGRAQEVYDRTQKLAADNLTSRDALDQARAELEAAKAAQRASSAAATGERVNLQFYQVTAGVPGQVGDVAVRVGDYVQTSTQITTIADADQLELTLAVPASQARRVKTDTPVEILDDDGGVLLTANVFYVAAEADPQTQLVALKASFANTVGLRPAELVRVRVVYATTQALQLPFRAVMRQSGQSFAYVLGDKDGQTVVLRKGVELGELGADAYVVQKGLVAGDRVAASSLQYLRDGAAVTVNPPPGASGATGATGATAATGAH